MIQKTSGATIITGTHINLFAMLAQRGALKLELKGIKMSRGVSAYAAVKRLHGFTGTRVSVLAQLEAKIEQFKKDHPAEEK